MEEWIGQQWHRLITRWAEPGHTAAAVSLDEMRKPLGLLLRCGGGPAGMRIGPAAARSHGGPRGWAQREREFIHLLEKRLKHKIEEDLKA